MAPKTITGNMELAKNIKARRNELGLTIEEAATRAGVGTKTWSRYESGGSIRRDKYKGLYRALNWHSVPAEMASEANNAIDIDSYKNHAAWAPHLAETFGLLTAVSFIIGSDILLDSLQEDIEALSSMPRGSHVGEIDFSLTASLLPQQFLMRYDYDFLYLLRHTVTLFRSRAPRATSIVAHSVIEELALYLIMEESKSLMEIIEFDMEGIEDVDTWDGWAFDIFDDMDVVAFLYSDFYLIGGDTYHFDRWLENQFYCE